MDRKELRSLIKLKENQIKCIEKDIFDLRKKDALMCDSTRWYVEVEQEIVVSKRPKVIKNRKLGLVKWNETFYDEDTHEPTVIERSEIVKINGIWQI